MLKTLLLLYVVHNIPRDEMKKREAESKWCLVMSHQHTYMCLHITPGPLRAHSFVTTKSFLLKLVEYE